MARLATIATPDPFRRIRRRPPPPANSFGVAKPFRFLPPERPHTLRDRAGQWWLAVATGFQPGRESEGMGLRLKESLSILALRAGHLWKRGSHRRRFVPYVCRVRQPSR